MSTKSEKSRNSRRSVKRKKKVINQERRGSCSAVLDILQRGDNDEDFDEIYSQMEEYESGEEDIYEHIKVQKEVMDKVRYQPWPMAKKLRLISLAKAYVEKHEGALSRSHGYHERGLQALRRLKRNITNIVSMFTPWEMRIKAIESHFGSVVASYFVFLRWLIWINIWLTVFPICFVIIPELIAGEPHGSIARKQVPEQEKETYSDLKTIWNAEGILKYSIIFYGYYGNSDVIGYGYRLPLAYLLTGIAAFAFSFVVLLRRMAANARLNRMSEKEEEFTFSWKLFGSWDYTIGNSETANTKYASNVTTFRETILEAKHKEQPTNKRVLLLLRVIANILVLMLLALSTYIIQLCVERSREMEIKKRQDFTPNFWDENELTIVMTLIATIFPNFFDLISMMEKYHPRVNLRWMLARIFALNLLNLYTLFIALFWKQQDLKQEIEAVRQNVSIIEQCTMLANGTSTPSFLSMSSETYSSSVTQQEVKNCSTIFVNSSTISTTDLCWETMIGQEVFKLTIMDLVFTLGTILIQDFLRGLFVRYCNKLCCWDLQKTFPEYGDFKTAENLLHLINNQGMIWLGSFFAPGLPVLNIFKLLILVYARCWSVMACNVPQETIFRASRSNNFYYALLLIMLFLSMLPPLFAIVTVEPSPDCGPFSGHEKMFKILTLTIENELPSVVSSVLEYAASPGVIIPVFMLLGMLIYYLVSVGRALRDANNELRTQLEYERTEGKRKIYAMADAKRQLEQNKADDSGHRKQMRLASAASSVVAATRFAKMLSNKAGKPIQKQATTAKTPKTSVLSTKQTTVEPVLAPVAVVNATQKRWKKLGSVLARQTIQSSAVPTLPNIIESETEAEPIQDRNIARSNIPEIRVSDVSLAIVNEQLLQNTRNYDVTNRDTTTANVDDVITQQEDEDNGLDIELSTSENHAA